MDGQVVTIYLDNSALIDISEALDGDWMSNEPELDGGRRHVAAARVAMYGHPSRGWELCSSSAARDEHLRGLALSWLDVLIDEVPSTDDTAILQQRFEAARVDSADAQHCAIAASHPWIQFFVTNDKKILSHAPRVDLEHALEFITVEAAEVLLAIAPGEVPPTAPAESNPLSEHAPWWVPDEDEEASGRCS